MHETVIAAAILKEAQKYGDLQSIHIEVGELGPLPPEELLATLRQMTQVRIDMTVKQAKIACPCSFKGRPTIHERGHDYVLYSCPRCGNAPQLMEGNEIFLKSVEIEKK